MPSSPRVIIESSAATVWGNPALAESLLRSVALAPDILTRAAAGRPVKISHDSIVVEVDWPTGDRSIRAAVKQYRPRNVCKALLRMLRPARAIENWRKAELLLHCGVATPRPLLACQPHGWKESGNSYLATQWIDGAENLHVFGWRIAARPLDARLRLAARCAEAAGQLLGRMHAAGAAHRDLKAANLIVAEADREVTVYLVDLDGLRPGTQIGAERRASDLARLAAGLLAHPWVTRSICRRFLRAYVHESSAEILDWKLLWRGIARETARYIAGKQQRGQPVL
jgi:tRNA A-37 threonylcarbamoyl transferase component Bud32